MCHQYFQNPQKLEANPLAPFGLEINDQDQLTITKIPSMMPPKVTSGKPDQASPTQWLPQPSRNDAHSSLPHGQHLINRMMKRQANSTNPDTLYKQVKAHQRPTITSHLFQGIRSIFQRHDAKPPTYPMGEGVCYHPELNNLDEETTTDEDEPYFPQPSLNRGDENL